MAIQVTIIGLGKIGASFGLALAKVKDQVVRIGNDREPVVARQAEKMGAIDKIVYNVPSAVRDADVIILAVPADEVEETIRLVAPDLQPGALLVDTSPVKARAMDWAHHLLPGGDGYFVALTPSLNPTYLMESGAGVELAHADLFQNSLMLITTPPGIDESAIDLAVNLTKILGATPLFADTAEADGLMAASHLLPQLVAAALVNVTTIEPGWREARKLAGHTYAGTTEAAQYPEESKQLGMAAMLNPTNTVRLIDSLIAELHGMREAIAQEDHSGLQNRLELARGNRALWLKQRLSSDWEPRPEKDVHIPHGGEMIGRLIGLRPRKDKK